MKFKYLTFLLVSFSTLLNASVEDHFKKAPHKSGNHQMRNVDFIYMINLDQRPEKFAKSLEQLKEFGIYPYRFSAVNGWELTLQAINDVGVKYEKWMSNDHMGTYYAVEANGKEAHEMVHVPGRTYFCHCMPRGSIGIVLSHLSILQDAYDSGHETIWVMEDDIQIIKNPLILSDLIAKLDKAVGKGKWDVLFTDLDTKNKKGEYVPSSSYAWRPNYTPKNKKRFAVKQQINKNFRKIGSRFGAYSMIIRRSGMKKILDFIKANHVFLPYDIDFVLPNDIQLYTVLDDVVSTRIDAPSDNGGPYYQDNQPK